MTGLENIIARIREDARTEADQKTANAQQEADRILVEAKAECDAMRKEASEKAAVKKINHESRVKASAEQQKKTLLLSTKQEIIADVIEQAYITLKSGDTNDYFQTMKKILKAYALSGSGDIYFSQKDLNRMPKGFEDTIHSIAAEKGGSLTLKKEPRDISDGFILVYGGVEENCTLKALFSAKKDELQDLVNKRLFC